MFVNNRWGFKTSHIANKAQIYIFLLLLLSGTGKGQVSLQPRAGSLAGQADNVSNSLEPGLLFYLSGENKYEADFASGGQSNPNYLKGIKIIPDGAVGPAFEAGNDQLLSYWAPGNIYAQRGTLSFYWRSRYPVGPTPFPVFRVGFADHTSWDMVWLRIDYNGNGFDAFVTDAGLARTRVSYYMEKFPEPNQWIHIAFSWDETEGVRFYMNGELAETKSRTGKVYDAGLDQFGPHSRIISPYQVQSAYNFLRGGDFDELRIYDRMLSDENVKELAMGKSPFSIPDLDRDMNDRRWRDEWWERHGWNLPNDPPPSLNSENVAIKKIGIHDAFDVKRWTWKANDGIRETTWPGVYNMSRLPGRYDYFVLPDWDCYSISGQSVKFHLPDENWNHVEIFGTAWGQLTVEKEKEYSNTFAVKSKEQIKSFHRLDQPVKGGKIRYDNALIEEPIGELGVYYVHEGKAPRGVHRDTFYLHTLGEDVNKQALKDISDFINGRYPEDERAKMSGTKKGISLNYTPDIQTDHLPFIHLLIPYDYYEDRGLDGVEIKLPALNVTPTHGKNYPVNLRIKDPLWPLRDMADFSFSVVPGKLHTLWMDTRDRLLPENRTLYITLAGAGKGLTREILEGTRITLIYKTKDEAAPEHELDRITQVRDLFSHVVEEHPSSSRLNLYNRMIADISDLLRINPDHWLGKAYKYQVTRNLADRPELTIPEIPPGVPKWAFLQTQHLKQIKKIISYYIDNRQISNGEYGGGLSDDNDFTNSFVGAALMGIEPEKIENSLKLFMEGYYNQDRDSYDAALRQRSLPLFTNGLATIKADELHSYEEGIEAVGQMMMVEYGNPLYFNRGMEISKRILEDVTGIAPDGHRYFRSRYYSGTDISQEEPWQWSKNYSYLVLHTAYLVARYNGNPSLRKMIIELADGIMAHRDENGEVYTEINFNTGEARGAKGIGRAWPLLKAAYDFTGDSKYLLDGSANSTSARDFDPKSMEKFYSEQIIEKGVREYIETDGSIWIDRVIRDHPLIQEHRLGGVALVRANHIYPQNLVSWKIRKPANYESLALFLPKADSSYIEIIAYNLEKSEVISGLTLWDIIPGNWNVVLGTDEDNDQKIDSVLWERNIQLEKGKEIHLNFLPEKYSIVQLKLNKKAQTTYWERPDLALCESDIKIEKGKVLVKVFNLGAVKSPEAFIELKNKAGKTTERVKINSIEAPLDLIPKWTEIVFNVPDDTDLKGGSIKIDPDNTIVEITTKNNTFKW